MTIIRETAPLFHKSWLLFRKNKVSRIFRILIIPALLLLATTLLTAGIFRWGKADLRRDPSYEPIQLNATDSLRDCATKAGVVCSIGIAPSLSVVPEGYPEPNQRALFEAWKPFIENEFSLPLVYFQNSSELESHYASNISIFGGIVFDSSLYPLRLTYDVRLPFSHLAAPAPYERPSLAIPEAADLIGGAKTYLQSGFNQMQMAVDVSLANFLVTRAADFPHHHLVASSEDVPLIISKRSPLANTTLNLKAMASRGPHSEFDVASTLTRIPITIYLSFASICSLFFQSIAAEKASGIKEYLHAMGLSPRAYWLVNVVLMLAAVAPLCGAQIGWTIWAGLWGPNALYGSLYLVSFALCTVAYTMMNGTLSETARAATLWNVLYFIPPILISQLTLAAPFGVRVALCLLAPFNLLFAVMSACKQSIVSITGATERLPAVFQAIPDMPPSVSIFFFAFDLLLYVGISFLVSWLRNRRVPPLVGEKEKKLRSGRAPRESLVRPFGDANDDINDESARLLVHSGRNTINSASDILSEAEDAIEIGEGEKLRASRNYDHFEPRDVQDPSHSRISIKNLSLHSDPKNNPEIAPLDLRIDDGIYVFVGGHSCGKSALLSIISGFDLPTTGSVSIQGANLYQHRDYARANLSVCTASNHFFDQMTAREHLEFVLSLRQGEMDDHEMMIKVNEIISDLGLDLIIDEPIEKCTAGMLRSLMVAAALLTPANIVILDEPSTGMNLEQKEAMWRAIMRKREAEGTTFVVATQCLSEAETIADRIGIMFNGRLLREGSIEFLTRKLGFQLHLKDVNGDQHTKGHALNTEALVQVPVSMKETLPQQIKALEEKHGVSSISVVSPSLAKVMADLEESLDESTDDDQIHDMILDDRDQMEKLSASAYSKSPLYRETPPKRANAFQQMVQYMKRRIPVGLRNIAPTVLFFAIPLALTIVGLAMARVPGHSLHGMPQIIHALRPHSTDPVPLGIGLKLPLRIPIVSSSRWTSDLISPWALGSQLAFPDFQTPQDMYNFLWKAEDPPLLIEGGLELNVDYPSQISYNLAFNMSEVYSTANVLNMVNNMAIRLFLAENVGFILPANISSPFIQIRSSPLIPREDIGLKRDSDSETVDEIVSTIMSTESGFPTQISISLAIVGVLFATQLLIERDRGLIMQLRRSGLRLVSYWLGTMLWAAIRMVVAVSLVLAVTAVFKVSFVIHAPMGVFFLSLLLASWTLLPMVAILIRRFTLETAQGVAGVLVALVIGPKLIETVIAPILTNSKVKFLVPVLANVHFLSPLALFPAFVQKMALAYSNEGFTTPSIEKLLSFQYGGMVLLAQLGHLLLWIALFCFFEFKGRSVAQHTEDEMELGEWELENGSVDDPNRGFGAHVPPFVPSGGLQRLSPLRSIYHSPKSSKRAGQESVPQSAPASLDLRDSQSNMSEKDVILEEESYLQGEEEARATDYRAAAIKTIDLVKRWDDMPRRAIPPLNLSIPIGHSYAMVGPKNSGKTTILSLLLGDEASTSGQIEFYGNSAVGMNRNRLYNIARFGACLQRDAVFDKMTVQEHVELYLSLRNDLLDINVSSATQFILQKARLLRFANMYAEALEKGPKQKLNLALAALTFTETLILDEPTRGCDAASRRTIWELLRYIHTDQNKTLLVSTPSLEEGLATCGSVGILVNGEIVAASSPAALHRACSGFVLRIWITDEDSDAGTPLAKLQTEMKTGELASAKFVSSQVSRNLSICATYDLPSTITLSAVVDQLNREVQKGLFIDYHITSNTPELAYQRAIQHQADDYSRYCKTSQMTCSTGMKIAKYAFKLCK
jgi:ABC-type multidrug transport system ATPase subunit